MTSDTEAGADLEAVVVDAPRERRPRWWVRWVLLVAVVGLLGVMGTRIATLTEQRDDAIRAAEGAGVREIRARQDADLRLLESEFRTIDLLVLPEVDGLRSSLAIVGVVNRGEPRTWLLFRASGARAGDEYALTVEPCSAGAGFSPFTFRRTADADGDVELVAQNLAIPYDDESVALRLHQSTFPVLAIEGPLVKPDRIVTGDEALDCPG